MTRRRRSLVAAGVAAAIGIAVSLAVFLPGPAAPTHRQLTPIFPRGLFERPVTAQPIATDSGAIVQALVAQIHRYYGVVTINGMPVLTVGPKQPRIPIAVQSKCTSFTKAVGPVPVPAGAYSNGTSDDPLVIFQPSTHTAWELWKAKKIGDHWQACWGGRIDTATSDGVFPWPYGLSASGISYLATTITDGDVSSGTIKHALALQVVRCNYHIAPASRGDCSSHPGQPSEGTWFRMPSSVAMPPNLTPYGRLVFRALQTYGAVVMDQAGAVVIQGEDSKDWTVAGRTGISPTLAAYDGRARWNVLNGIPWSDLEVIVPPTVPVPTA